MRPSMASGICNSGFNDTCFHFLDDYFVRLMANGHNYYTRPLIEAMTTHLELFITSSSAHAY